MVCDGVVDDGIDDAEVFDGDARWQVSSDVMIDDATLFRADIVKFDETVILLMCDVLVVDVLENDEVVGLVPLDAMKPTSSISWWIRLGDAQCFPLMQHVKDDVEVVVNDELAEDEVFAKEDVCDGQDEVLLIDHGVLHTDDVLPWCVHWWCSMMKKVRMLMNIWCGLVDALQDDAVCPDELPIVVMNF